MFVISRVSEEVFKQFSKIMLVRNKKKIKQDWKVFNKENSCKNMKASSNIETQIWEWRNSAINIEAEGQWCQEMVNIATKKLTERKGPVCPKGLSKKGGKNSLSWQSRKSYVDLRLKITDIVRQTPGRLLWSCYSLLLPFPRRCSK